MITTTVHTHNLPKEPIYGGILAPHRGHRLYGRAQASETKQSRGPRVRCYFIADFADGVTRHTALPTSSATSSAPCLSIRTPTGRPCASPLSFRNPVRTSCGLPDGMPFANGMKITL